MSTKQKSESNGLIAIVGDRELVIGYRLLGINETFQINGEGDEPFKTMEKVFFFSQVRNDYCKSICSRLASKAIQGKS
jgi:vacuolar-type H+-ATPase subunit F/Vma7